MKRLEIENKIAIIGKDDLYIPFTYKVVDFENADVINVPASKTITLPFCQQNDEIFGYIGKIERKNIYLNDDGISAEFNPIKKCEYTLYYNSKIVSSGLLIMNQITNEGYECSLIDGIISKLEILDREDNTLNNIDLYDLDDNLINFKSFYSTTTPLLSTDTSGFIATVNYSEDTNDNIYCYDEIHSKRQVVSLPEAISPIQAQSVKDYDVDYAIKLKALFQSLNKKDYGFGTNWLKYENINFILNEDSNFVLNEVSQNIITEESNVGQNGTDIMSILNDTYFICQKLKTFPTQYTLPMYGTIQSVEPQYGNAENPNADVAMRWFGFDPKQTNQNWKTGVYQQNPEYRVTFKPRFYDGSGQSNLPFVILHNYNQEGNYSVRFVNGVPKRQVKVGNTYYWNQTVTNGTVLGTVKVRMGWSYKPQMNGGTLGSQTYSNWTIVDVQLIWGDTIRVLDYTDDYNYLVEMRFNLPSTIDLPISAYGYDSEVRIINEVMCAQTEADVNSGVIALAANYVEYNGDQYNFCVTNPYRVEVSETISNVKTPEKYSGMDVNASTLMPTITVKNFLLQFVKFFKLGMKVNVDGQLEIFRQNYSKSKENLIIDNQEYTIQPKTFDYSKLTINSKRSKSKLLEEYEKKFKKTYGEQIINTGYSIKQSKKKVEFDNGVPLFQTDAQAFAYDRYCSYLGGGYSRYPIGNLQELPDVSFAYSKLNVYDPEQKIYGGVVISNDHWIEFGFSTTHDTGEKQKSHINPYVVYNPTVELFNQWKMLETIEASSDNSLKTNSYYTLTPYKFADGTSTIEQSLELSKPEYNYAGITDANYAIETTHYYRYFRKNLIDFLNVDTKILKTKLFINGEINYDKIYNYKNTQYIIKNLPEYDLTTPNLYDVELLKINDETNYIL